MPDHRVTSSRVDTQTIADIIAQHAAVRPDGAAIVGSDFTPFCFRDLDRQLNDVRDRLRAADLGPASRIGMVMPSGPEAALLGVAICAHAIAVPLNPALTAREIEAELPRLDAVVLPGWLETQAAMTAAGGSLTVFHASKASASLSTITLRRVHAVRPPRRNAMDIESPVALLLRTSGTTGAGKTVPVTHANLIEMANRMRRWFDLSDADRCGCILPLHYAQGFKSAVLVPLLLGGSTALAKNWHLGDANDWIADLRPTWFSASPAILRTLLERLRSGDGPKQRDSLRFILSSSSYLPENLRTQLETMLGVPVLEFYGLTEAGVMAANAAPPARNKPGTAGLIAQDELTIHSHDGSVAAVGDVGEIAVHGPSVTPGYINETDGSVTRFRDGWLATGDLGFIDPDGFLTITGRTRELINRGGEKVSPYEIEKALLLHPAVSEAAAFSVPHSRLGQDVAAAAVLRPAADATPAELRDFLRRYLARSKVPQRVLVLGSLPRGPTGKILRSQLATDAADRGQQPAPSASLLEIQIADIWQRLIGRGDIGVTDNFFEAGGDSLLAEQMLLQVEAIVGHGLPQSALTEASTIRELAMAVINAAPPIEDRLTCVKRGSGVPFFFGHGDLDSRGFYALRLADLLGSDQAVFLLHPDRSAAAGSAATIEAMARTHVVDLLAAQPVGAFRLGGYCNGGLLVWEIAHQLETAGRRVELVVLINTISLNARMPFRAVQQALRIVGRILPRESGERLRRDVMCGLWHAARSVAQVGRPGPRRPLTRIVDAYFDLMSWYHPPAIDSTVACLVCDHNTPQKYAPLAWKRLARSVHYQRVAGDHLSSITTHAQELASLLTNVLVLGPDSLVPTAAGRPVHATAAASDIPGVR